MFELSLLTILHVSLVAMITLRILIREDLSGAARLAWFITILTLPIVGPVTYIMLGEIYIGQKLFARYRDIGLQLLDLKRVYEGNEIDVLEKIEPQYREAFRYTQTINGFALTNANTIRLLETAESFTEKLVTEIDAAQSSVNLLFYIWLPDRTGLTIANALMRAAKRGITCRVMVDELGSRRFSRSRTWKEMKAAGVKCGIAMPYQSPLQIRILNRFDLRNHRKVAVIDGRHGFVGSRNCADPEYLPKKRFGPWVDMSFWVEGPVINQLQAIFAMDWIGHTKTEHLRQLEFNGQPTSGNAIAVARGTGPLHRRNASAQSFTSIIHGAQQEIIITTPYFVPDRSVVGALCTSALSGVRVVIMVPRRNDSWIVSAASRSHYRTLLKAGIEIHEYVDGLLHAKSMTIDGKMSIFGSSNLDVRSFDLNFENDLLVYGVELAQAIRKQQQAYLDHSVEVSLTDVRAYPAIQRIWHNVVGTLSPVL